MLTSVELHRLVQELAGTRVLSVYLDTRVTDPAMRHAWRPTLLTDLREARASITEDGERDDFDRAAVLLEEAAPAPGGVWGAPGWVAFVTAEGRRHVADLLVQPSPLVTWRDGPVVSPYLRALKQQRPVVVALVESRAARLYRYAWGELEELSAPLEEVPGAEARTRSGGRRRARRRSSAGRRVASSSTSSWRVRAGTAARRPACPPSSVRSTCRRWTCCSSRPSSSVSTSERRRTWCAPRWAPAPTWRSRRAARPSGWTRRPRGSPRDCASRSRSGSMSLAGFSNQTYGGRHDRVRREVAIVTGGGSGIGEAIAKALASKGVKVVVSDINLKGAERVARDIAAAGGTASAVQQDTARPEDSERVVSDAESTYGALHYAVNNAGIGGAQAPAGEVDLADWERVIDINLNGVLYGMRYQIPAMLKAGARSSAIVDMASIHGTVAAIGNGAYTAAKHAVVGLTRNAAAEYGPQGLRINCVVRHTSRRPSWRTFQPTTSARSSRGILSAGSDSLRKSLRWSASSYRTKRRSLRGGTT